jgi:redox-sensitive bicupin YhaK (pirin superfamily)
MLNTLAKKTVSMPTPTMLRPALERGETKLDWLKSYHSFSFGDYFDRKHMAFGNLRVINDDYVAPGQGFGMHGHRDMEIVTIILDGELAHKDSLGNGATIRPGEVQRMTAGSGIMHSEFNPSATQPVHLLQIWIMPEAQGLEPSYEQAMVEPEAMRNRFHKIAGAQGGTVKIHQQLDLWRAQIAGGQQAVFDAAEGQALYIHIATGGVTLDGRKLDAGDALMLDGEGAVKRQLKLEAVENSDVLIFAQ